MRAESSWDEGDLRKRENTEESAAEFNTEGGTRPHAALWVSDTLKKEWSTWFTVQIECGLRLLEIALATSTTSTTRLPLIPTYNLPFRKRPIPGLLCFGKVFVSYAVKCYLGTLDYYLWVLKRNTHTTDPLTFCKCSIIIFDCRSNKRASISVAFSCMWYSSSLPSQSQLGRGRDAYQMCNFMEQSIAPLQRGSASFFKAQGCFLHRHTYIFILEYFGNAFL